MRSTYSLLKFLRTIYILVPLTSGVVERNLAFLWAFSYAIYELVYYIFKKLGALEAWKDSPIMRFSNISLIFAVLGLSVAITGSLPFVDVVIFSFSILAYYFVLKILRRIFLYLRDIYGRKFTV